MNRRGWDEEDFARYQPAFVESYLDNRSCQSQTIEEWTALEGEIHFPVSDIYAPVRIAVAISGSERNGYAIDLTKDEWYAKFLHAVSESLIEANIAKPTDTIKLEDVRRDSIEGRSIADIEQIGVIYTTVNGVRTVDMPTSKIAGLGCAIKTPATHSISKERRLEEYISDVCGRVEGLCMSTLGKAKSMVDIERIVSKEDDPTNLKHGITEMILKDGGVSGLPTFSKLIETYSDPDVLNAIRNGVMSEAEIASEMSRIFLDEVARSMQSMGSTVESFYEAKVRSDIRAAPSSRTIFGSGVNAAAQRIEAVMQVYPTATKLHRDVLNNAFYQNDTLGCNLIMAIKKSGRRGLGRRNGIRHTNSSISGGPKAANAQKHGQLENRKHAVRGDTYSKLLGMDIDRLKVAFHRSNALRGLPPHPGSVEMYTPVSAPVSREPPSTQAYTTATTANANASIRSKVEVPSLTPKVVRPRIELEPYIGQKSRMDNDNDDDVPPPLESRIATAAAAVATTTVSAVAKPEPPSVEFFTSARTKNEVPLSGSRTAPIRVREEVPSLEFRVKQPQQQQQPISQSVVSAAVAVSTLPSLSGLLNRTTALNNILAGPISRVK